MKIDQNQDGISHINIYSQGRTDLGRMLSNFAMFQIQTKDGVFQSVEGYWHWLGIEDCMEKKKLRILYGYDAKKYGTDLKLHKQPRFDNDFESKILHAIWYKVRRNQHLFLPQYQTLPFEHYYVFGGKTIKDVKKKYLWMINGIDKMRNYIKKEGI